MARTTRTKKTPAATPAENNVIRIKETDEPELFHAQDDPYVLPPELNITVRDGFRFGLGFILAMLIFWTIVGIGAAILVRFGANIFQ